MLGRHALITGSAAGIGLAMAKALASRGMKVVGADRNAETPARLAQEQAEAALRAEGLSGSLIGIVCDVTSESDVEKAVSVASTQSSGEARLDLLICNAGIFPLGAYIDKLSDADWERTLAINLTGSMRVMRKAIPLLRKGTNAQIIVIGSRNVAAPGPGAAAYSASKAALVQLARVAALELAPEGIRVNIIHPDAVFDTELWTPEALKRSADRYGMSVEDYQRRNLMKTRIVSHDVAEAVCALAGNAFLKTTGAQIPLDGGNDRVI
jgi:NAD(P)-dependent dehydrogenase (short-subunit alcohol dehydrogenase family)